MLSMLTRHEVEILLKAGHGKAGHGKTYLAVAIGYRAIQNGFETLCTTAAELIEDLSNVSAKGILQPSLPTYTRPHRLQSAATRILGRGC
jgi:hypothetical protein